MNKKYTFAGFIVLFFTFAFAARAFAADPPPTVNIDGSQQDQMMQSYNTADKTNGPAPQGSVLDYSGLVKCDGVKTPGENQRQTVCDFTSLMSMINSGITYLFTISVSIAVVLFAYAGLLYMTGEQCKIKKAKEIFVNVGKGFIIMLVAWVAVYTVVNFFVKPDPGATSLIQAPK